MTGPTHRFIVAGKIPTTSQGVITYTHALLVGLTGNQYIKNPNPTIQVLTDLLSKFELAETATKTRTKGTIGARNAAKTALLSGLHAMKACVQQAADADPENAEAIITSTSLSVRKVTARTKPPFAVKQGPVSGAVNVAVKSAGPRAAYDWEYSVDGGKSWTAVSSTTKARTSITGLPAGTNVLFRFRSVTPKGESDWSQPISMLVK